MNLIDIKKQVKLFGIIKNELAFWYNDYIQVGNQAIKTSDNDDYGIWDDVFVRTRNKIDEFYNLVTRQFEPWQNLRFKYYFYNNIYNSQEYEDGIYRLSYFNNGIEYILQVKSDVRTGLLDAHYVNNELTFILSQGGYTPSNLLFYSTTGERLWEYKTENPDWKINRMCIPMVDDVVVIINSYNLMTVSIEGYNIQTGEKLWVLKDDKHTDIFPCHFNVGDDKMLYACKSHWKNTDRNSKNIELTSINPHNGEFNRHILKEVDQHTVISPWNTCIYGNKLYYADNRLGCVLGVVDLDKKQIVDEFNFNLKKGFTMGAPVVTEDKIYQFIRNKKEVWVFDK
ncbi:MAG: hypothetical protein IJR06_06015 [Paludibacteraceae bacterium]|nr:hypothetical protein [Paludibacteraceae bacterium]